MAKSRQMVFRVDDDLSAFLDEAAEALNRSRAMVICSALLHFSKLTPEERRNALLEYQNRDVPKPAKTAKKKAAKRKRSR